MIERLAVCELSDLTPERGVAALVGGEQIALFRTSSDEVYAVQQLDPFSGANVMSRGIVGTRGDAPTVASPMYKQVFDLRNGECLEAMGKEPKHLRVWPVTVLGGVVLVDAPARRIAEPRAPEERAPEDEASEEQDEEVGAA